MKEKAKNAVFVTWCVVAVYGSMFVAGYIVGKALAMVDGRQAVIDGFDSAARWRYWPEILP